jgi:tRNA1Val (adenine37-N6)-methyltransferase
MPEDFFRFKEFTVWQDGCAMKVTTEGCLFGAWLASHARDPRRILDIGAGTGLLMLMTAQAFTCPIDGVEIDPSAAAQAGKNLSESPWAGRCTLYNEDIVNFQSPEKYDLLVSNPPFHTGSLKSADGRVNLARHDDTLTLKELISAANRLTTADGSLAVWLPCMKAIELEGWAVKEGWSVWHRLQVSRKKGETPFRTMTELRRIPCEPIMERDVYIRDTDGNYGEVFKEWLSPYYLNL